MSIEAENNGQMPRRGFNAMTVYAGIAIGLTAAWKGLDTLMNPNKLSTAVLNPELEQAANDIMDKVRERAHQLSDETFTQGFESEDSAIQTSTELIDLKQFASNAVDTFGSSALSQSTVETKLVNSGVIPADSTKTLKAGGKSKDDLMKFAQEIERLVAPALENIGYMRAIAKENGGWPAADPEGTSGQNIAGGAPVSSDIPAQSSTVVVSQPQERK